MSYTKTLYENADEHVFIKDHSEDEGLYVAVQIKDGISKQSKPMKLSSIVRGFNKGTLSFIQPVAPQKTPKKSHPWRTYPVVSNPREGSRGE